ncbi:Lsr2 family protein [Geodermatophilus sp. DF01-2]|nr:Lsr2 family protein [Geodermatophilus sp. DF01_2]
MAKRTIVTFVDDLNDEPADTTVSFGLDNQAYELDLTDKNAEELRDLIASYISAGRKVSAGRRSSGSAPKVAKPAFSGVDGAAVRAWAAGQGIEVSPRGRIKAEVIEKFRAAGN